MDVKKRNSMFQLGIGISIACTKLYVEVDLAKLLQLGDVQEKWGLMIGQMIQPDSINNGRYDCS